MLAGAHACGAWNKVHHSVSDFMGRQLDAGLYGASHAGANRLLSYSTPGAHVTIG